ncbi:MAG: phosphoribosylanthranilate isomerase [Pseudomonadales bacterium]|nr:phosphoribosylanthranilate isomerase [Pseudomonadales bacterium]
MRTRIKICGLTRMDDALYAANLGVDALGLVFYPGSPRYVDMAVARQIVENLPPFVTTVGLFVDPQAEDVIRILGQLPLSLLQFHGHEEDAFCRGFGVPFVKALQVRNRQDLLQRLTAYPHAQGLLLDAWHPDLQGGTGQTYDWNLFPARADKPLILAGGLKPDNVTEAVRQTRPWAVDVSGGVESAPGLKDPVLMRAFVEGVRNV